MSPWLSSALSPRSSTLFSYVFTTFDFLHAMAMSFPLELVAQVLEHCPTPTLLAAALACANLQREAERMLYCTVTLRCSDSVQKFCHTLSLVDSESGRHQERRAAAVRRLYIRTSLESGPGMLLDLANITPGAELAGLVRGVLPGLRSLVEFECNWCGPSHGILAALPRGLTFLALAFDLDGPAADALRALDALRVLSIKASMAVALSPPDPTVHQCAALARDAACLPALRDLSAPRCCALALLRGRAVRDVHISTLVTPFQVATLLAAASPALKSFVATLLFGGGLALETVAQASPLLEELELVDTGVETSHSATDAGVENALRSLRRLRLFRLFTSSSESFLPDAMEESSLTDMILRWTRSASPALEQIRIGRINITDAGGLVRWTAAWLRKDGKWLRS